MKSTQVTWAGSPRRLQSFKVKIYFEISLRDKTFKTLLLTKISGRQYPGKLPIHIARLKLCT
jgi:hypothetical protein